MSKTSPERTQFLADVFTTAIEGGIDYWAIMLQYRVEQSALIADADSPKPYTVSPATMARGLARIRKQPYAYLDPDARKLIIGSDHVNDGCDLDASLADAILQIAVFDEVRYG